MFAGLMEALAERSPDRAERTARALLERLQQAVDFPMSGRVFPEYGERSFREILAPPYRVMYRVRLDGITVEVVARSSWRFS